MSNVKLSCQFCGQTNYDIDKRGNESIHTRVEFSRCKNCGTVLCWSCNGPLTNGKRKNCGKCGAKKSMVVIHRKGAFDCYVTTATMQALKKPDDCYELQKFRYFRDNWVIQNHPEQVVQYYETAPSIIEAIEASSQKHEVYERLWNDFLSLGLRLLEQEDFENAYLLYQKMLFELKGEYLQKNKN